MLNQFDLAGVLPLYVDNQRLTQKRPVNLTKSQRAMRSLLGKFGLRPAEALLAKRVVVVEGPNDVNFLRALIELQTNLAPEHQDLLIVPVGGKGQVSELCLLLDELGADWRALFDWDAAYGTNQPLFKSGLATQDVTAAKQAIAALQPLLFSRANKTHKSEKLLNAMSNELTTPFQAQGIEDSVLAKLVWAKLTSTQRNSLRQAVSKSQPKVVNTLLDPVNVYLWKSDLETAVVPIGAELDAEGHFVQKGLISGPLPVATRRKAVLNKVKDMAHEPEQLFDLVKALWNSGRYSRQEAGRALAYLLG
ncbi:hypothetical protein GCM10027034_22730 [Ramlibacter solisilvae]